MKVYQMLKLCRPMFEKFNDAGIQIDDAKHLELFEEYTVLKSKGEKISYIINSLSDKYAISERSVYRIIRKFDREIP